MQLTTGPPLLFALGLRILVNSVIFPSETPPSTSDFLLTGLFHGVLLYHTLTQLPHLVLPVAFGIAGWVLLDFLRAFDATKCACTLLGAALGVLITDVLDKFFENEEDPPLSGRERSSARDPAYEPSRRLRLVSFGRSGQDRHRTHGQPRRNGHAADELEREREREDRRSRRLEVRPLTPTLTYASTAPSISLDSVPSSIDPEGKLSPHERAVAVLRARASLADSERRRFKEERKWALSQGNTARASQLAWQVKRYAALMESFHREADAKVIEGALSRCALATIRHD